MREVRKVRTWHSRGSAIRRERCGRAYSRAVCGEGGDGEAEVKPEGDAWEVRCTVVKGGGLVRGSLQWYLGTVFRVCTWLEAISIFVIRYY